MVTWQLHVSDPAGGGILAQIVDAPKVKISRRIGKHDQVDGLDIDGGSVAASKLADLATDLLVHRDDTLLHRGRILPPTDDIGPTAHTIPLESRDYRWLLHQRILQSPLSFTATDEEAIGWGIVDHLQTQTGGNLGITRDGTSTGTTRDRTEYAAGDNAGELLDKLERVDGGPDFDVGPDLVFRAWPARGSTSTLVLHVGTTVDRAEPVYNGSFANAVRTTGDDTTAAETRTTAGLSTDPRGRWDAQVGFADVSVQATVAEHAEGELAERSRAVVGWKLRLADGVWAPDLLGVGDTVPFVCDVGRHDVDTTLRTHQIDVDVDLLSGAEQVTVYLDRLPPDWILDAAEDRRRLTALERTT